MNQKVALVDDLRSFRQLGIYLGSISSQPNQRFSCPHQVQNRCRHPSSISDEILLVNVDDQFIGAGAVFNRVKQMLADVKQ
ncbi:hypothetical protein EON81_24320 [bacterium]|nr:MAG: hypothetical protein EON81_24320 [bacterium]